MSLYFIDPSVFVKKGVVVNITINIVPKNPQKYLSERTHNATPSQKAALPKKSLLYVHQLFGIKCDTKQYQIFQEQVFWEDGAGNDVDFGKMLPIIAQKGTIGEVIVANACK